MEFHSWNIMNINVIFPGDSGKMAGSWEDGVRISPMGKSMGKSIGCLRRDGAMKKKLQEAGIFLLGTNMEYNSCMISGDMWRMW